MCLSAALILLIWGFFHTVEIPEEEGGGIRRSPSGLALIGAVILMISSILRIENESYHFFWFMILPATVWIFRRFFRETPVSRGGLTAATVILAITGIMLLALPENPQKAINRNIVKTAAANTLQAIENGNAEVLRQKYSGYSGFASSERELQYWSSAAESAASMPVNTTPPASDSEKVEAKPKLTMANSIFGYWTSIIAILIGTLVVVLAPYYMALKMPISYRCRIILFITITLAMFNLIVWGTYADDGQDYKKLCRTLTEKLGEPGGTVKSAEILGYWLKNSPDNPGLLRRYFDGSVKLPAPEKLPAPPPAEQKTTK